MAQHFALGIGVINSDQETVDDESDSDAELYLDDLRCRIDLHEPCPINQIIHHMDHLVARDNDDHFSRIVLNEIVDSVIHHGNEMHPDYDHTRSEIYELYTKLRQRFRDFFHQARFRGFDERGYVL